MCGVWRIVVVNNSWAWRMNWVMANVIGWLMHGYQATAHFKNELCNIYWHKYFARIRITYICVDRLQFAVIFITLNYIYPIHYLCNWVCRRWLDDAVTCLLDNGLACWRKAVIGWEWPEIDYWATCGKYDLAASFLSWNWKENGRTLWFFFQQRSPRGIWYEVSNVCL